MSRNDPPDFFLRGALPEIPKKNGFDRYEVNKAWEELPCSSKSQYFDSTLANDKIAPQYVLKYGEKKVFGTFL